jgi:hypothetical protein
VDLREKHSWTMKLGEVETPELLEVLSVGPPVCCKPPHRTMLNSRSERPKVLRFKV